jgi:UDP-N-acetylglucosamine--N-acetylmuramyl-(pentapeptide) pyrophosphoryl-undecaprenol N-acetylglucosamine transferase
LCAAGKASIFVPSPNVAEDHQTHNAMALVHKEAAIMVKDVDAQEKLMENVEKLLSDKEEIKKIQNNILKLSKIDAAKEIAEQVLKLMR